MLLDAARPPSAEAPEKATRALEAMVLKQMLSASGVFHGGEGAGSSVRADLFADALADAVANAGGIGLGAQLNASLSTPAPAPRPTPSPHPQVSGDLSAQLSPASLVAGGRLTSGFGQRTDPIDGHASLHPGVDVAAAEGTPIRAAADGIVRSAGERGGYGFAVEIDHGHGTSTLYGHASQLLVQPGQHVSKGQEVARVGHTGRSTGPHLHFEVRVDNRPADPAQALKAYAARADEGLEP